MKLNFRHWRLIHAWGGVILSLFIIVLTVTGWIMVDTNWYGTKQMNIHWGSMEKYYQWSQPKYDSSAALTTSTKCMTFIDTENTPFDFTYYWGKYHIRKTGEDWVPFQESHVAGEIVKTTVPKRNRPPTWFNFCLDIHTGVFFARSVETLYEILSFLILLLTFVGLYMWWKPWSVRKNRGKEQSENRKQSSRFKIPFTLWRKVHRYLGFITVIFFVMWAVTGFILMDENVYGLRKANIEFYLIKRWYEIFFPEYNFANIEYEPMKYVTLTHQDGYPVHIGYHDGEFVMRKVDGEWEREWASNWKDQTFEGQIQRHILTLNWSNVIWDLHTGLFFVHTIDWLYEVSSILIAILAITGIYIWWVPWKKKRTIHQKRENAH